jgi:hypothetical protein
VIKANAPVLKNVKILKCLNDRINLSRTGTALEQHRNRTRTSTEPGPKKNLNAQLYFNLREMRVELIFLRI